MSLIGTLLSGRLLDIIGVAWALILVVLVLGGLWLWMDGHRDRAVAVATATAETACAEARAEQARAAQAASLEAVSDALRLRAEAQAELDAQRDAEQAALREQLAAQRARAHQLSTALRRHIDANPLPVVCRLDAERVRLYNALRRGGAPARAATDRPGLSDLPGRELPGAAAAGAGSGWHGEPGRLDRAGGAGWGSPAQLPGGAEGVPAMRAPGDPRGRDPMTRMP